MKKIDRQKKWITLLAVMGILYPAVSIAGVPHLVPHKAIYDIRLISAKSGGQVVGVSGQMLYQLQNNCDGYISDHRFLLNYDYSGAPAAQVNTKFTSFESHDGRLLHFSSTRFTNGEASDSIRGRATLTPDKGGEVIYSIPNELSHTLPPETFFPAAHTLRLISAAQKGTKQINLMVFDGSDENGASEINTIIGKPIPWDKPTALDKKLMTDKGWEMYLAAFPTTGEPQETSDYEMSMELLDNGIVRNMTVDYHDFSVSQKLVAFEPLKPETCGAK